MAGMSSEWNAYALGGFFWRGFFVGKRGKISQEASGYLGVGLSWPQGVQSPNFAVGAGVSWRF
jgi:hypothetical protein